MVREAEFTTLTEMAMKSISKYANKNVFGTYNPSSKSFDWVTYAQFGRDVQKFR